MANRTTRAQSEPVFSVAAWLVHLFTATGAFLALLAVLAIDREQFTEALLWLLLALVIDAIDGTFARAAKVKERIPRVDGDLLDLVIDYLTYVFVPTLLIWRAELLPQSLFLPLAALILISSLYVFARSDMKTSDGYFRGFPALWNIVALYLLVTGVDPWTAAIIVGVLAMMSFAPIHVVHPFRVRDYGPWLLIVSFLWAASTTVLLLDVGAEVRQICLALSFATSLVILGLGLLRTVRRRRRRSKAI